jgi:hypothetical protein
VTSPAGAFQVITMTEFELSFQFPMNRVGASPVVAAGSADSVASGSIASGSALSVTAGAGAGASSPSLSELETRIAPRARIPRSTANRTFVDEPCFFDAGCEVALGFVVAAAPREAVGVVETFTRDEPVEGTGGITNCEELLFFAAVFFAVFLTTFLAEVFFAVFLAGDFFAVFLAVDFLTAFLAGDFFAVFFAADFLAADFFGAAFLAADFFFTATFISLS